MYFSYTMNAHPGQLQEGKVLYRDKEILTQHRVTLGESLLLILVSLGVG